jgi:ferredoxin
MMVSVTFLPNNITISVEKGTTILEAMIRAGLHPDAPCGGRGTCGKCKAKIDGNTVLACQTQVHSDLVVRLSPAAAGHLAAGGWYITSGILDIREEAVSEAIREAGFDIVKILRDGEWRAVVARKK